MSADFVAAEFVGADTTYVGKLAKVMLPRELVRAHRRTRPAIDIALVEVKSGERGVGSSWLSTAWTARVLVLLMSARTCAECGRWNYHLTGCSRGRRRG